MAVKPLPETAPKLYTSTEAAAHLGVSHDVVDRWIRDGTIRFVDVGTPLRRRARIREDDLLALIKERTHEALTPDSDPLDSSA